MTRFLIADNPMVEGSPSAIIHTIDPVTIIECMEGHQRPSTPYRHYSFVTANGLHEDWTLRVHHLMTTNFDADQHHLIVTKLLDRAWHWYKAYMQWEDEQE